ncbi:MAG: histidine--tRNA ligase [Bacteroidales bacterium]|nr:histidine--tRNA ligase [Bacteroidales bacterium]
MKHNVSIPKGTRDFTPQQVIKRQYIFNVLKDVFTKYGYLPIETPAMETLSTLLGKYGEEGDKLIFRIINSGNFFENISDDLIKKENYSYLLSLICEKGLRYDLTVPFARYVVMHHNQITFPFKRYQIQPVWRADKPQKGRYREFYQCDIDVIGSKSLLNEIEIIQISDEVFSILNIPVIILINHRNILYGIAKEFNIENNFIKFTTILDKLGKIDQEKFIESLKEITLDYKRIIELLNIIENKNNSEKIMFLKDNFKNTEMASGINDIEFILENTKELNLTNNIRFEISLARGLSYYTGTIFEIKSTEYNIGSLCGGGRYDNLTEIFGLPGMSGVGISFGADRIYDIMEHLNKFPNNIMNSLKVLVICMDQKFIKYSLTIASKLRNLNIPVEVYPDIDVKLKKQLSFANNKGYKYVLLIGENEYKNNAVTLKDMYSGNQQTLEIEEVIKIICDYEKH